MSLFGLRPEEPAAIRIREAATRGTLSHALLLTGSGDRMSAACFAAAALECTGEESRPCGVCPACRKVLAGIHPDVITVRDPDHKNIAVDVVRAIRADAYIRPNEVPCARIRPIVRMQLSSKTRQALRLMLPSPL